MSAGLRLGVRQPLQADRERRIAELEREVAELKQKTDAALAELRRLRTEGASP